MQLGLLGMLLGLPNGALTSGQGQGGANTAMADMFAQLLGDPGQSGSGQKGAGGQLLTDIAPSALVAQEVAPSRASGELDALSDLLNQEISADDASALLEQFDALSAELTGGEGDTGAQEVLRDLKAELKTIVDTGTPKTVAAVLTQLPALHAAPAERAPVVERMLAWMKGSLSPKQKDAPTQEATVDDVADPASSPIVQSLQAMTFRDADPAAEAPQEAASARDYIEIIPLSMTVEAAAPAWVKKITEAPATPAISDAAAPTVPALAANDNDAATDIPGLEVTSGDTGTAADAEKADLPEISLPRLQSTEQDAKVTDLGKFRATMENHVAQQSPDPVQDENAIVNPTQGIAAQGVALTSEHRGVLTLATAHSPGNHAPVAEQVHVAIQRATKEGIDQLTISLEPADLGRVEVKMHTGQDGQTQLSFLVDKAETMDALSRDARSLERALQDAGVKADAGNMQFNLRQQSQGSDGQPTGNGGHPQWKGEGEDPAGPQASAIPTTQNYNLTLRDGVDIRA